MSPTDVSHARNNNVEWSFSGWFGGAFGGCIWMVIVGCVLATEGQILLAAVPLTCSFATMMAAVVIWRRRFRMTYLSGVLSLIGVLFVTTLTAWLSVSEFANNRSLTKMNWPASNSGPGYALGVLPLLLGLSSLWLQSRRHIPTSERQPTKADR